MTKLRLLTADRRLEDYTVKNEPLDVAGSAAQTGNASRIAYSAVHVVADPLADNDPWLDADIDWDRTIAFRRYVWSLGLGVAEAMDTAQRGMGVDWDTALELIRRSLDAARATPGALIASGVGTDHLSANGNVRLVDVIDAYEEQIEAVEALGGRIVLMASRALTKAARSADDYLKVYDRILSQTREPVIIHWLGEMFDPALAGYWGSHDHNVAMDTALKVIEANPAKVDGIKISLLSKEKEIAMRRRLPAGVRMYTGDDFNYAELIAGDDKGYSDALLGIFDAIAPAASAALAKLSAGNEAGFHGILAPTVPLSRHIFQAPTRFYKTGVVFLAYLNGHQDHFTMVGGQQSARSLLHLCELFRLADAARVLRDPDVAAGRMRQTAGDCRSVMSGLDGLSINLATVREQWDMRQAVEACLKLGITAIAPWRDQVERIGLAEAARIVRDNGMRVTDLCRGGMFPAPDAAGRQKAIDDNLRAIDEAVALRADCLVLVSGGLPDGSKDIAGARAMVHDGLGAILSHARACKIPLAIEPLHPMYAADRCCINTLAQALDLCDGLGEGTGVAIDVYHVWWDPDLFAQIARAGRGRQILAHHICDWLVPTRHLLLDRGMMGDGVIDFRPIRRAIEAAGYHGPQEVEILSEDWWKRPGEDVLRTCVERYRALCAL